MHSSLVYYIISVYTKRFGRRDNTRGGGIMDFVLYLDQPGWDLVYWKFAQEFAGYLFVMTCLATCRRTYEYELQTNGGDQHSDLLKNNLKCHKFNLELGLSKGFRR